MDQLYKSLFAHNQRIWGSGNQNDFITISFKFTFEAENGNNITCFISRSIRILRKIFQRPHQTIPPVWPLKCPTSDSIFIVTSQPSILTRISRSSNVTPRTKVLLQQQQQQQCKFPIKYCSKQGSQTQIDFWVAWDLKKCVVTTQVYIK